MARCVFVGLILLSGCALPLADFGQVRGEKNPSVTTLVDRTSTESEAKLGIPITHTSGSERSADAKTPDASTPTRQQPSPVPNHSSERVSLAENVPTVRAAGFAPAEPSKVEREISLGDTQLSAEQQEFLRNQLLAVLAQQTAATAAQKLPPLRSNSDPIGTAVQTVVDVSSPLPGPEVQERGLPLDARGVLVPTAASRSNIPRAPGGRDHNSVNKSGVTDGRSGSPSKTPESVSDDGSVPASSTAEDHIVPGQWRNSVALALTDLQKELARFPHDDHEAATLAAYVRLLHLVNNQSSAAVTAIDKLPDGEREYWKHQLHALIHVLDADQKNPTSRRFALALRELRSAVDELSNASALDVRNLAFCSDVDSFGCFTEFRTHAFRPGQEVVLYVELENFTVEPVREKFETALQGEYTIVDDKNVKVTQVQLPYVEQACNNRLRDYFIAYNVFLPKDIRPGQYRLQLTIEDLKGHKSGRAALDFGIR